MVTGRRRTAAVSQGQDGDRGAARLAGGGAHARQLRAEADSGGGEGRGSAAGWLASLGCVLGQRLLSLGEAMEGVDCGDEEMLEHDLRAQLLAAAHSLSLSSLSDAALSLSLSRRRCRGRAAGVALLATRCDLATHIRTILPYAALAGVVSLVFGDLAVGLGLYGRPPRSPPVLPPSSPRFKLVVGRKADEVERARRADGGREVYARALRRRRYFISTRCCS